MESSQYPAREYARQFAEKWLLASEDVLLSERIPLDVEGAAGMLLEFTKAVPEHVPDWTVARCLDHGYVHLVDSMPHYSRAENGDARIVQAARVSMAHLPAKLRRVLGLDLEPEDRTPAQDERLIRYLMTKRHTSPLEKVRFEFMAHMPLFVARQLVRHRMASINEVSARYSKLPCEFYVPELIRMQAQSKSNKQASGEVLPVDDAIYVQEVITNHSTHAYALYEVVLRRGLTRELARMVLPLNYYTTWYWTLDLHNLLGLLNQRLHEHAQYETRVYAEAMLGMIKRVAPIAVGVWEELRRDDPKKRATRAEGKLAALVEWSTTKKAKKESIAPEELLAMIEMMLQSDQMEAANGG